MYQSTESLKQQLEETRQHKCKHDLIYYNYQTDQHECLRCNDILKVVIKWV